MFSWFKKRRNADTTKKIIIGAQIAINRMGELIEKYPSEIMDENWLPLEKIEMKKAFKIAWLTAEDNKEREFLKIGWMMLANFQPGVGETPISPKLPQNPSPDDALRILGPYLKFSPRIGAEMAANGEEFEAFIASQNSQSP